MIISAKSSYNYLHGGTHLYATANNQETSVKSGDKCYAI